MIKINQKYFNQVQGEPIEVQDINGEKVSIYYLDEQPFYNEFIGRGKFFFWSSCGNDTKLIIESGYYNVMKDLFQKDVNKYWLEYYNRAEEVNRKARNRAVYPLTIGYVIFFVLYMVFLSKIEWFQQAMWIIFIGIIIVMFVGMNKISKYIRNRIDLINDEIIKKIKKVIGKKEYENLLKEQEKYRNYFYRDPDEEQEEIDIENNEEENNILEENDLTEENDEIENN